MADESGEKTEEPTHKKIEDSRKEGQVWQSKDLTGVIVFVAAMGTVKLYWGWAEGQFSRVFHFAFEKLARPRELEVATIQALVLALGTVLLVSIPVIMAGAIAGAVADFLMVGPLFTIKPIMPKFQNLNPLGTIKSWFSKKSMVDLVYSTLKIGVAAYVVYGGVRDRLDMVAVAVRGTPAILLSTLGELIFVCVVRITLLFVVFAIFDVWWQRRSYMKDLMMTKDEVKREYKESEGDPHHKAKRREMHQEILESAMMEGVRDSDVVVTNPDHVAVALRYDQERDPAPKVVAKGLDFKAQAIKELAKNADVAILRNVPLAHALVRLDVGAEIPEELYDAVAEVLNFVYGLRGEGAG